MNKTEKLINSIDFGSSPDKDMLATEIECIKQMELKHLGRLDPIDLMYYAYKLGFAKALVSTGIRVKDFDKLGVAKELKEATRS